MRMGRRNKPFTMRKAQRTPSRLPASYRSGETIKMNEQEFKQWISETFEECWNNDKERLFPMAAARGATVPFAVRAMMKEVYRLGFLNGSIKYADAKNKKTLKKQ